MTGDDLATVLLVTTDDTYLSEPSRAAIRTLYDAYVAVQTVRGALSLLDVPSAADVDAALARERALLPRS